MATSSSISISDYFCSFCHTKFDFKSKYDRHLKSSMHKWNVMSTYESCEDAPSSSSCSTEFDFHTSNDVTNSDSDNVNHDENDENAMDCFSPGQNSISDLQGLIDSDEASPESNYYPFTSRIQALLYMLIHSPHPIGETNLKFIFYAVKFLDPTITSLDVLKRICLPDFIPPMQYTSSDQQQFSCILPTTVVKQCFGNPVTASKIVRHPEVSTNELREMYHGKIWHSEFPSPMTSYGSQKHVFVNDFVLFSSDVLGQTTGKVKEIFREEGFTEVKLDVVILLSVEQLWKVHHNVTVLNPDNASLILHQCTIISVSQIVCVTEPPQNILRIVNCRLEAMDHNEYCLFVKQHPIKVTAAGLPVVVCPLILFSDDTSGNKSKKWNKFDYWSLTLASLPICEARKFPNIHFLCCSNRSSSLEIVQPIVDDLMLLEKGVIMYDAYLQTEVLVLAPVIAMLCDNARASEIVNHLGSRARKFCRKCNATAGDADIGMLRSKSEALRQIHEIEQLKTERERKTKRTEYGIKESKNPLFTLSVDLYRSTPVETLHTVLLGSCKYMLRTLMDSLSVGQKKEVLAQIRAWSYCGFSERITGNIAYHYKSFVGRDFKAWLQMVLFIIPRHVTDQEMRCWFALVKLFRHVYCMKPTEAIVNEIAKLSREFISLISDYSPEFSKRLKVHILLHLADDIRNFGPASLFNTERFESFNSLMRSQNIYSNRQSPSKDIAMGFAVLQHLRYLCSGGFTSSPIGTDLKELYRTPQVQGFMNFQQPHELFSEKSMYQPGTLRKLKHGSSCISIKEVLCKACIWRETQTLQNLIEHTGCIFTFPDGFFEDSQVMQYRAVVSMSKELVDIGSFIQLQDCSGRYGIMLAVLQASSPHMQMCLVWMFDEMIGVDGTALLSHFECPLISLSRTVKCESTQNIKTYFDST